jgi:hypothetical protein
MAKRKPPSPFLRFNSSPEIIRLVVMIYVKGFVRATAPNGKGEQVGG